MKYTAKDIANILSLPAVNAADIVVEQLLTDSRKLVFAAQTLFFALPGPRRDGHEFIETLYDQGVRCFVVNATKMDVSKIKAYCKGAIFFEVPNCLEALQQIAAHHRALFTMPVIGITGSNGKTIVKEWLYQLLHASYHITKSPRSFNSQIGVPLSVWKMDATNDLAIFEAGISTTGEMQRLAPIIKPTIGVLTHMGPPHAEGFANGMSQKINEKLRLFESVDTLIYGKDQVQDFDIEEAIGRMKPGVHFFSWSRKAPATLVVTNEKIKDNQAHINLLFAGESMDVVIPFTDKASTENAMLCILTLLALGKDFAFIKQQLMLLSSVDMRMQFKKGINGCTFINDSYNLDFDSFVVGSFYLQSQAAGRDASIIVSDFSEAGPLAKEVYSHVAKHTAALGLKRFIGIGPTIKTHQAQIQKEFASTSTELSFYDSTSSFLQQFRLQDFYNEIILLKGARVFEFERIANWLEQKMHETVLEINLTALAHNVKQIQHSIGASTKLMAVVKAFSYGNGSAELARTLASVKTDYLAVAYVDEGVELRKAGIHLPIMVMSPDEAGFEAMVTYGLEPEIYSFEIYNAFGSFLKYQGIDHYGVHLKFNTGMNRLGFEPADVVTLATKISRDKCMIVKSVMSHLVASDAPEHDTFTMEQITVFKNICNILKENIGYSFIRHIANSHAVLRHPDSRLDMVRVGIGLYGTSASATNGFRKVASLKTTVAQIRKVPAGATVGYERAAVMQKDTLVATVRIGYADGYDRRFSLGAGKMYIRGVLCPVVGLVCMDMTMIDVSEVKDISIDDEVEIFGEHIAIETLATWSGINMYEMMSGINARVKRVYIEE
ncbi:MAG: bifunctional UDP-N-acetylmuramoyl-tripeptide:D-alanyl-D-alanine ligase/alanine racemase [Sediminibacterium sp.]